VEVRFFVWKDDPCVRGERFIIDTNLDVGMSSEIQEPLRGWVLGDHVEAAGALGKPDFDFTRLAGLAASRGDIQVLLASDLLSFELEAGFVVFKELAKVLGGVEQACPLFVVKRNGKAAKAIDADTALLGDFELHGAAAFLGFNLLLQVGEARFEFFVAWFRHKDLEMMA
jgi:hypothetical protein